MEQSVQLPSAPLPGTKQLRHGTYSCYRNNRCRCDECRLANRDHARAYIARNRESVRERNRAKYLADPDKVIKRSAEWRKRNGRDRERERQYAKARYWADPERAREINRASLKKYPEKRLAREAQRRSLKAGNPTFIVTERDWRRLCQRYSNACAYCGRAGKLTQDHIIPVTRGGGYSIGNLLPACQPCNSSKRNKLLIEWRVVRDL